MRTRYLLACSGQMLSFLKKYNKNNGAIPEGFTNLGKTKDMRFYKRTVDNHFFHGDFLFSALYLKGMTSKGSNVKALLGIDDNPKDMIFIDSGGYSIVTGVVTKENWTNQIAFDISMKNGNIFPILDIPLAARTDFTTSLTDSVASAKYYKSRKAECPTSIILNVAHGRNLGELKRWTDKIGKIELDGWAVGSSHNGNPKQIIKSLFFMLTSGYLEKAKAFHVFGVSSASMLVYFAALKHAIRSNPKLKYNFDITFDSSYPIRTAAFGKYFMFPKFDGFTEIVFTNTVDWSHLKNDDFESGFFCDCPVCLEIKDFKALMNQSKSSEIFMWCAYHNILKMIRYIDQTSALVEMVCDVPGLGEHILPAKVNKNIQTIMEAFDNIPCGEEIIERKFESVEVESGVSLENFFGD